MTLQNDRNRLDASIFCAVKNGLMNDNRQTCVALNVFGLWQTAHSERVCADWSCSIVVKACKIWRAVSDEKALLRKFERARSASARERYAERIANKVAERITRGYYSKTEH